MIFLIFPKNDKRIISRSKIYFLIKPDIVPCIFLSLS